MTTRSKNFRFSPKRDGKIRSHHVTGGLFMASIGKEMNAVTLRSGSGLFTNHFDCG